MDASFYRRIDYFPAACPDTGWRVFERGAFLGGQIGVAGSTTN